MPINMKSLNVENFDTIELSKNEQLELNGGQDTFGQQLGRAVGNVIGFFVCTGICFLNYGKDIIGRK